MKIQLTTFAVLTSACLCQEPAAPAANSDAAEISGAFGVDFATHYYFRGILQEDQGVIGQPWFKLAWGLGDATTDLEDVTFTLGAWNSLHDGPTGSGGPQSMWYENDFYAALTAAVGERWSVGATYTNYYSPNARFGTVQEIALNVGYDDKDQLSQGLALEPSVVVAIELDGQADAGSEKGIYAQVGIAPAFAAGTIGQTPLTLTVPVTVGLSLGDYYEFATGSDDFLGYVDLGVVASAPLACMPARMGKWDGYVGLHLMLFGDNNELVNHGDDTEIVLAAGMGTSF